MYRDIDSSGRIYRFFRSLDRSIFIDNEYKKYAHCDSALPIGFEQTISQPSLVYEMTCLLGLDKSCKVLEIGTGSGYQTAFLAEFAGEVFTVERIPELSLKASQRLEGLGYKNIRYMVGDGSFGWPEYSPYDRIIVTAAAGQLPDELVEQLARGGRMVIPVGARGMQKLLLVKKDQKGDITIEQITDVIFVELQGKYGWK